MIVVFFVGAEQQGGKGGLTWVFPKIGVPQNGWFIRNTLLKWIIWGYHHFRNPPNVGLFSKLEKSSKLTDMFFLFFRMGDKHQPYPIASMYGIFPYIYHTNQPNVGKYGIITWTVWLYIYTMLKLITSLEQHPFPFWSFPLKVWSGRVALCHVLHEKD